MLTEKVDLDPNPSSIVTELLILNSRSALLNAAFLEAIVCSASAGSDPPLTSRAIMRLCSTKLDGTRKSPGTGIVLADGADAVHVLEFTN